MVLQLQSIFCILYAVLSVFMWKSLIFVALKLWSDSLPLNVFTTEFCYWISIPIQNYELEWKLRISCKFVYHAVTRIAILIKLVAYL